MKSLEHIIRNVYEGIGNDAVTQFASAAHEEWRKGYDPEGTGKERVKQNSDGTSGNINVPFNKLHPDWQKENLEAGKAALVAVRKHPKNIEAASEHVHNEWMKRNPKADWNASQHVPYSELPEEEKEKDRIHVRKMMNILGKPIQENISMEHAIRNIMEKKYKKIEKESSYGARDSKPVEEDVGGLVGSGTGGEPKLHSESGKKKKVTADEEDTKMPRDYGESIEEMNVVTNPSAQMLGRQFYTQSPLIGPPDVSQNSKGRQAAKRISMLRNKEIGKFSNKNVSDSGKISEENVEEQAAVDLLKLFGPKILQRVGPRAGALPKIKPVEPEPILPEPPAIEPVKPGKDVPRPDQVPANEPGPAPKTKPEAPSEPAPKPTEKPSPAPEKAPKTKPGTVPAPAVEPAPGTAPAPKGKPVVVPEPVKDPLAVPSPKAKPVTVPSPSPSPAPSPAPAPVPAPKGKPVPVPGKVPGIKFPFPFMPAAVAKPVELTGPHAPVATSVSRHRKHSPTIKEQSGTSVRKLIKDMPRKDSGDRHDIEYVGRKDADPKTSAEKTSRQAQYKIKVIDEAKKLADVVKRVRKESGGQTKVYDNVVINPDLNRVDNKDNAELKP